MLRAIGDMYRFMLVGTDGQIGRAVGFYFDDERWTVRSLVARTGGWLGGGRVPIPPAAIQRIDWEDSRIFLALARDQVEHAPDVDVGGPTSRRQESAHLRSCREAIGFHIRATDDTLGHLDDFLVDDGSWALRYLVVDIRSWWLGRKVLIPTEWVDVVEWEERTISVRLTRDAIRTGPSWDPRMPVTRGCEEHLREHYARPARWSPPEQVPKRPEQPQAGREVPAHPYPTEQGAHPG